MILKRVGNLLIKNLQTKKLIHRKIVKANTENVPIKIIGLRPYRSANFPQKIDVKALPIMNDDPNKSYIETSRIFQNCVQATTKSLRQIIKPIVTNKTSIETNIFFLFCYMKVSDLPQHICAPLVILNSNQSN